MKTNKFFSLRTESREKTISNKVRLTFFFFFFNSVIFTIYIKMCTLPTLIKENYDITVEFFLNFIFPIKYYVQWI